MNVIINSVYSDYHYIQYKFEQLDDRWDINIVSL